MCSARPNWSLVWQGFPMITILPPGPTLNPRWVWNWSQPSCWQGHQQPPGKTPIRKPSSVAWITEPWFFSYFSPCCICCHFRGRKSTVSWLPDNYHLVVKFWTKSLTYLYYKYDKSTFHLILHLMDFFLPNQSVYYKVMFKSYCNLGSGPKSGFIILAFKVTDDDSTPIFDR